MLRQNLKLQQDECSLVTNELQKANQALDQKDRAIQMLQRDLGYRSELDIGEDETQLSRLRELENEVVERTEMEANLREGMTEMQDKYDLLVAENEKLKQKYLSQKRSLLRRGSPEDAANVEKRYALTLIAGSLSLYHLLAALDLATSYYRPLSYIGVYY